MNVMLLQSDADIVGLPLYHIKNDILTLC